MMVLAAKQLISFWSVTSSFFGADDGTGLKAVKIGKPGHLGDRKTVSLSLWPLAGGFLSLTHDAGYGLNRRRWNEG